MEVAAELVRRSPKRLAVFETHPGGGLYDCLTLRDVVKGYSLVDANREGQVHLLSKEPGESSTATWSQLLAPGGLAATIESTVAELGLPKSLPAGTPRSLTYRVMAEVVGIAALSRIPVEWRSGREDSSAGTGGGVRTQLFTAFPDLNRDKPLPPGWAPDPAYRYWFLLLDGSPIAVVDHVDGRAQERGGTERDLFAFYQQDRSVWSVALNTLGHAMAAISAGKV